MKVPGKPATRVELLLATQSTSELPFNKEARTVTEVYSVSDHFVNKDPSVRTLYDQLVSLVRTFGPVEEDPKKTSIHLNRKSALAGVETRRNNFLLTIKSDHPIKSPRVEKVEKISSKRFYHKVRISSPDDFDEELKNWLQEAYALSE
jgi:uncharacterized protein DUF5655